MKLRIILFAVIATLAVNTICHAADQVLSTNIQQTDVNLFIPENAKVIRGVLINPADKNVGVGTVWGESCRHWGMAHMGIMLENVDKRNNRPKTIKNVIEASLKEFAQKSNHPELVNAPFLFGGMSKGGGWSAEIGQDLGPRTIAFNNVCGWVGKPEKDLSMPAIIVIGGVSDGFKMLEAIGTQYEPARAKGATWCLALQWGNAHNYGNANALAFPFLDAVIGARLPKDADPTKGVVNLIDIRPEDGWLGDRATWELNYATITSFADYKGDRQLASWLPNRYVAHVWRSFVSKDPPVQLSVASADGKLSAPPFKPIQKRFVIIPAGTSLKLTPEISAGVQIRKAAFYDGDIRLGESDKAPFDFAWEQIPAGPRSVFIEYTTADGTTGVSNPVLVITGSVQ